MTTKTQLIKWAKRLLKEQVRYLYGFKYEKVTASKLARFFAQYPNYYVDSKKSTAQRYIGDMATDCSGLISSCTGVLRSSQGYHDSAKYIIPVTPYYIGKNTAGLAVWKKGHIGVSIGKGLTIEAKGINYGVVQTKDTPWTHYLYLKDIDYTPDGIILPSSPVSEIIWLQDRLNDVLGADLEVDGQWGIKTETAVQAFARQVGKEKWCKQGRKVTLGMLEELI